MGRRFYLLGGRGEKPVNVYDPATNTWSEVSKPPIEIHHFQSVVYENRIWVLGALTRGYPDETPVLSILDLRSRHGPMAGRVRDPRQPMPHAGTLTVAFRDHVIVLGGESAARSGAHSEIESATSQAMPRSPSMPSK